MNKLIEIPIYQKQNLTIEEAAVYSNIGQSKLRELTDNDSCRFVIWVGKKRLRELTDNDSCRFVIWVGKKRLIKRKLFDEYIDKQFSI